MASLQDRENRAAAEPDESLVPELQLVEEKHDKVSTPDLDSNVETRSPKVITLRSDQPELMCGSPEKDDSPPRNSLASLDQLIFEHLKTVPFLKIPSIFGFARNLCQNSTQVVYQTGKETFKSMEELHTHLLKQEIPIPLKFFTFEPGILHQATHVRDFWKETTRIQDLSEGQECIPIPVICPNAKKPGPLATYVKKNFLADNLSIELEHEDGFFVCCSCDNDCKDKLKCPCFLKTLDNCSQRMRNLVGDENVGYRYQRLEQPFLSGIFECNRLCKCRKSTCMNRVVQNGIICPMQLFMTYMKGWGVRTLCDIPKGTFICTYAGKIVDAVYADKVSENWSEGRWKYLSELRPGEEEKEGYEEEAIEPKVEKEERDMNGDSNDMVMSNEVCEIPEPEPMTTEEWMNFMVDETNSLDTVEYEDVPCDDVPVDLPSPATSTFVAQNTVVNEEDINGITNVSPNISKSDSASKLKAVADSLQTHRVLRSFAPPESPHLFENIFSGLSGFIMESMEDKKYLCYLNIVSRGLQEKVKISSKRRKKSRKTRTSKRIQKSTSSVHLKTGRRATTYMSKRNYILMWKQIQESRYGELKQKAKEQNKARQHLKERHKSCSILTPHFLRETVLKTLRFKGEKALEGNAGVCCDSTPRENNGHVNYQRKRRQGFTYSRRVDNALKKVRKTGNNNLPRLKRTIRKRRKGISFAPRRKRVTTPPLDKEHPLLKLDLNIDGHEFGNIGRYLNHSCDPNIFPQCVFINSHDLRLPVLAFFASRNIRAGEELCWDYKYEYETDNMQLENTKDVGIKVEVDSKDENSVTEGVDGKPNNFNAMTESSDTYRERRNNQCITVSAPKKMKQKKKTSGKILPTTSSSAASASTTNWTRMLCHCGSEKCLKKIC